MTGPTWRVGERYEAHISNAKWGVWPDKRFSCRGPQGATARLKTAGAVVVAAVSHPHLSLLGLQVPELPSWTVSRRSYCCATVRGAQGQVVCRSCTHDHLRTCGSRQARAPARYEGVCDQTCGACLMRAQVCHENDEVEGLLAQADGLGRRARFFCSGMCHPYGLVASKNYAVGRAGARNSALGDKRQYLATAFRFGAAILEEQHSGNVTSQH